MKRDRWLMIHAEDYLLEREAQLLHPQYLRQIRRAIEYFSDFCDRRDITHPARIEESHILDYEVEVNRQSRSASYRFALMIHVKRWFTWMTDRGLLTGSPFDGVRLREPPRTKFEALSEDELQRLFDAHRRRAFQIGAFMYHREEAILGLMLGWGLEVGELVQLDVHQFESSSPIVRVKRRAGGYKEMPYEGPVRDVVMRWLPHRSRKANRDEQALLVSNDGTRLGIRAVQSTISSVAEAADVDVRPYMLRTTFGAIMLASDLPLSKVARLMGHRSTKSTKRYAYDDEELHSKHQDLLAPHLQALQGRPS